LSGTDVDTGRLTTSGVPKVSACIRLDFGFAFFSGGLPFSLHGFSTSRRRKYKAKSPASLPGFFHSYERSLLP
jgi:hypothetical protein